MQGLQDYEMGEYAATKTSIVVCCRVLLNREV